ncbi:26S proteasome non-ATPase regulatory subunit 4, partial [Tanacetum coccineum]
LLMEGGEVTVICVDTSITNLFWFLDQINAVEIYCQHKVKDHPNNLFGIVPSTKLDYGACLAPTCSLASLAYSYNSLESHMQEYTNLHQELSRLGWFDQEYKERKKRLVVFSGSPLLSTSDPLPQAIANFLEERRVVLDVVDFGPRFKDEEDWKATNLKALVNSMNHNNDENESSRYLLIEDDGFSLSRHITRSSTLNMHNGRLSMMGGEVTMICVDTSITSLSRFYDQIDAVEIYCERKLKAHPNNFVGIARFGQRDLGIFLYPTNCLEMVTSILCVLNPLEQEYTDLLQGFDDLLQGFDGDWFDQEDMKKRIVVFSGSPLPSTEPKNIAHLLKKRCVVLDVVVFGTRVKDEEDRRAEYLKALVDSMNHNNDKNESSHYFLIEDDGFSLSHRISSSLILPPLAEEEEEEEEEAPIRENNHLTSHYCEQVDIVNKLIL